MYFIILLVVSLWVYYYIYVNTLTTPSTASTEICTVRHYDRVNNRYISLFSTIIILFVNFVYTHNGTTTMLFWDSLYTTNKTYVLFYINMFILSCILYTIGLLNKSNNSITIEYVVFIVLIVFFGVFLIISTNLFLIAFVLEFVALLIFGKFTVSRSFFKQPNNRFKTFDILNQHSYGLFTALFFQFWANFISSLCLFFTVINLHYFFGTSNVFLINFFMIISNITYYTPTNIISFIFIVFITGLFIKFGLAPYQFFKIETYKGIPLFLVVVYTTLYLSIYILFFLFMWFNQIPTIRCYVNNYVLIFIIISLLYLISLLFDTKNFKAFLSYSTLITMVNLFVTILVI